MLLRLLRLTNNQCRLTQCFVVIADYLARLPGAVKDGARIFSTHSLCATTATLLPDAGVDIRKVQ